MSRSRSSKRTRTTTHRIRIDPAGLAAVRERQVALRASMQTYHVRHPADLPIPVLLAHRADRFRRWN